MVRWIWAVGLYSMALFLGGAALAQELQSSQPVTSDTPRRAYTQDGQAIEVKPLDAAGNPYSGQYGEWDYWVWEHYDPTITYKERFISGPTGSGQGTNDEGIARPEGWRVISGEVNEEGWLIPYEVKTQEANNRLKHKTVYELVDPKLRFGSSSNSLTYRLMAGAVVSEEFLDQYSDFALNISAAKYPPIPAWLGEHSPLETVFLDGGQIAVYGALDLHVVMEDERYRFMIPPGEKWYLYSIEGELLAETGPQGYSQGRGWINLFFEDYESALDSLVGRSRSTYHYGPYLAVGTVVNHVPYAPPESMEVPEVVALFNYKGERLDLDTEFDEWDLTRYFSIRRDTLEEVYSAQVRLGITDPNTGCPLWGKPGGPVITDPAPRPQKKIATDWSGNRNECVAIRPLDDQENPYSGQYQEWDRWSFENIGKSNPEDEKKRADQQLELQQILAELAEKGEKPTDDLYTKYMGIPVDPNDAWKHITLNVDVNGFVKPLVDPNPPLRTDPFDYSRDPGPFKTSAGGIMPEEMYQAYEEAKWRSRIANYPEIPKWLADAPPFRVTAGPDGEWIARGELGSLAGLLGLERNEFYKTGNALRLHRYSPEGKLIEIAPDGVDDWPFMYSPALAEAVAAEEALAPCQVVVSNSFVRLHDKLPEEECGPSG